MVTGVFRVSSRPAGKGKGKQKRGSAFYREQNICACWFHVLWPIGVYIDHASPNIIF